MKNKNLWCQREEHPLDNNSVCGKATIKGGLLCPGHDSYGPIWPIKADGSLFDYDKVPEHG